MDLSKAVIRIGDRVFKLHTIMPSGWGRLLGWVGEQVAAHARLFMPAPEQQIAYCHEIREKLEGLLPTSPETKRLLATPEGQLRLLHEAIHKAHPEVTFEALSNMLTLDKLGAARQAAGSAKRNAKCLKPMLEYPAKPDPGGKPQRFGTPLPVRIRLRSANKNPVVFCQRAGYAVGHGTQTNLTHGGDQIGSQSRRTVIEPTRGGLGRRQGHALAIPLGRADADAADGGSAAEGAGV